LLDIILDEFHFSTLWNGGILLFILFGVIIYLFILPADKNHSIGKTIIFFLGLVAVFAALGSPINVIARIKFSTHIIQLALLLLVAPPLLIIGFKANFMEKVRSITILDKSITKATKPIIALIVFYALFYGYHIPVVFNFARIDLFWNYFFFLALFVAAILLWVPIMSPDILSHKQKKVYALINTALFIPYSLILFLAPEGIYSLYTNIDLFISSLALCLPDIEEVPPEFFVSLLPFDPVHEQQLGGMIFLVSQVILFLAYTFLAKKLRVR